MNEKIEEAMKTRDHKLLEKCIMGSKMHRIFLERELNKSGVYRSQHQLLMYIAQYPDASQKEIANHHHVSTATIAVSLKKLEKGGYISREVDKSDNRCNQIRITAKGQSVVDDSVKVFKKADEALFRGFSEEEKQQLERFVERIRLNLEYLLQDGTWPEEDA